MHTSPVTVVLDEELRRLQERWLAAEKGKKDAIYLEDFAPRFVPLFAELPLHGAPADFPRPRALISLLGFSWQPVVLLAAWAKPQRLLILATEETAGRMAGGETVTDLIRRLANVPKERIRQHIVGPPEEIEIYRIVKKVIGDLKARYGIEPREVYVDPTGGKKTMSAAAALAAFVAGCTLVYVDYTRYDPSARAPVPGTEYPRLLANPLEVFGDQEMRDISAAFSRGDYSEAARLAERLASRLYEPREAETLKFLAEGYAAWDRFDFQTALNSLEKAYQHAQRFGGRGRWHWLAEAMPQLEKNIKVLKRLVATPTKPSKLPDGLPLILNYLAAAERRLNAGKTSSALLLTYAAVERYACLCLTDMFGLDPDNPDYSLLADTLDEKRFHKVGRMLVGKNYERRNLSRERKLGFSLAVQLVATLAPDKISMEDLGILKGLAANRNKCEYEHGFLPKPPQSDNVGKFLRKAAEIVSRCCGASTLQEELSNMRFVSPHLEE